MTISSRLIITSNTTECHHFFVEPQNNLRINPNSGIIHIEHRAKGRRASLLPRREVKPMTVYEALSITVAVAMLIVTILAGRNTKK